MEFTKEEKYHLDISKIVCDYNSEELTSKEAMKKITNIDIEYLNQN